MDGQQQQQRCLRHPRQRNMVGVCSSCLRERLNALAEYSRITDAYNPPPAPPPPRQPSSSSILNLSSSSTHQINKHINNNHHQQDHTKHSSSSSTTTTTTGTNPALMASKRPPTSHAASEPPAPHALHKKTDHHHQSEQKQLPLQPSHTQASHSSSSSTSSSSSSQKQRKSTGVNTTTTTTTTTTTSACSTSSGNGSRNTAATATISAVPATAMASSNSSSQRVMDIQEDQELQELQQQQYYHHHQYLKKPEVQRPNTQQPHDYYKKRDSNSKLKKKDAENATDLGVDDKMTAPRAPNLQQETQSCTVQMLCEHPDQQGVQSEHEDHDLHDAISSCDFKENMNIIINSDAGTAPHAKKKKKTSWFSLPTTSKSKSTEPSTSHRQQHQQAQTNSVSARSSSADIKSQPRAFVDRNGVLITSGRKSTGEAAIGSSLRQVQLIDLEAISEINHSQSTGPSSWISSLFHRKPKGRSKSMLDAAETDSVMSAFASGLSVNQSPKVSIDAGRLSWDGARPNFRQILKKLEIRNHQNKQRAVDQHYHQSPVFDHHHHQQHNQVTIKAVIADNQDDDYHHNHVIINKSIADKLATHDAASELPSQHQHPFTPPPLSKCKSVSSGRTSTLNPNLTSSNHSNQGLQLLAHDDINSATDSDDRNFPRSRSLGQRAWTRTLSPLLGLKQQYARKDR